MNRSLILLLMAAALIVPACGSSGAGDRAGGDHDAHMDHVGGGPAMMPGNGMVPGRPADPSDAERKIAVVALDDLSFEPGSVEVSAGEVVTFVVRNEGSSEHEFVLGDEAYQENHGDGMRHDMSMPNAVSVAPGETAKLTWRFNAAGEVFYGCHEPGHYDGGMVGTIQVT